MPGRADALRDMATVTSIVSQVAGQRPAEFWIEVARIVCERHGVTTLRGGPATEVTDPELPSAALSKRRREVLAMYAGGLTHGQVATRLGLAEDTIKQHLWHARRDLGAHSTCEAVAIAMRAGLID